MDQNTAINDGKINGTVINLKSLGVGNGFKLMVGSRFERFCLTVCGSYNNRRPRDALTQYLGYVKYFVENLYNVSIARETTIQIANNSLLWIKSCLRKGDQRLSGRVIWFEEQMHCSETVFLPLIGGYDVYNARKYQNGMYPPSLTPRRLRRSRVLLVLRFRGRIRARRCISISP